MQYLIKKNLQSSLDGKADSGHNHDSTYSALDHSHSDLYLTKSE